MADSIDEIERYFRIKLPTRHRMVLLDLSDPIHKLLEILYPESNHCQNIFAEYDKLRRLDWKEWPGHLVAFASNGCGDYFAYNVSNEPYRIYYIGPIGRAQDEVEACERDGFVFSCFDEWYLYELRES